MNATSPLGVVIPAGGAAASAAPAAAPAVSLPAAAAPVMNGTAAGGKSLLPALPLPEATASWGNYLQAIAWLCFILAALWVLLWLLKKTRGGFMPGNTPTMRIESRLAVGPKKWIMVARFLDKRLVLGVTEQHITLLTELSIDDESHAQPQSAGKTFASLLKGGKEAPAAPGIPLSIKAGPPPAARPAAPPAAAPPAGSVPPKAGS